MCVCVGMCIHTSLNVSTTKPTWIVSLVKCCCFILKITIMFFNMQSCTTTTIYACSAGNSLWLCSDHKFGFMTDMRSVPILYIHLWSMFNLFHMWTFSVHVVHYEPSWDTGLVWPQWHLFHKVFILHLNRFNLVT